MNASSVWMPNDLTFGSHRAQVFKALNIPYRQHG